MPKGGQPVVDLVGKKFGMLSPIEYIKGGKWKCLCDCGKETIVDTRNLNSNHTTSCGCKIYSGEHKHFKDITGFENEWVKVIKKSKSLGNPPHTRVGWLCLCKNCGGEFIARSNHIINEDIKSCGCLVSLNEKQIKDMLTENNVEFATQYTFPDLKGPKGGALRFDFAVFNKNHELSHLIEYNGAQHYIEVKAENFNWCSLSEQKERDQLKIDYCKKHNIPLIIIPYNKTYTFQDLILENKPVETIPSEIGSRATIDT